MSVKPPFGTLGASIAKLVAMNAPRAYIRIVEPFGDGGTMALFPDKRKPKEHHLNVENEDMFNAFTFAQSATNGDLRSLKSKDWIGLPEIFEKVAKISAKNGVDWFYRWLYVKHFAAKNKDPDAPLEFDLSKFNRSAKSKLWGLPLMRALLRGVKITNDDPMSVVGEAGFNVLLPNTPDFLEATKTKIASLGQPYIFLGKIKEFQTVIDTAKKASPKQTVTSIAASSIMMGQMEVVLNYPSRLKPLPEEVLAAA